jgi:DNA-binding NarL/FixJ family response regulator
MNEPNTISIIESDNRTRQILSHWIDCTPGFRCLSGYADTDSARRSLPNEGPDLVLVDLHLPDAIGCVRELKALMPRTSFIMLSVFEDVDLVFESLAAGASGCLAKDSARAELIAALGEARRGVLPMNSPVARKALQSFNGTRMRLNPVVELGTHERVVLELQARGYRCGQIAAALGISPPTVNAHLCGVYVKLQARARSRTDAGARPICQRRGGDSPACGSGTQACTTLPAGQQAKKTLRTVSGFLSIKGLDGSRTVTIAG